MLARVHELEEIYEQRTEDYTLINGQVKHTEVNKFIIINFQ